MKKYPLKSITYYQSAMKKIKISYDYLPLDRYCKKRQKKLLRQLRWINDDKYLGKPVYTIDVQQYGKYCDTFILTIDD